MIVLLLFHVGIMLMTFFFFFFLPVILLCVDGLYFMIVLWTT